VEKNLSGKRGVGTGALRKTTGKKREKEKSGPHPPGKRVRNQLRITKGGLSGEKERTKGKKQEKKGLQKKKFVIFTMPKSISRKTQKREVEGEILGSQGRGTRKEKKEKIWTSHGKIPTSKRTGRRVKRQSGKGVAPGKKKKEGG